MLDTVTKTTTAKKPRALRLLAWLLSTEQRSRNSGGAKGIRTPDLLHAIEVLAVRDGRTELSKEPLSRKNHLPQSA
jgi:hypothetical protein